ncbi:MAG TPA: efflux RND transporter periplasmic adaptor subunit [Burkholderiaceae bacterium]|nr:efflux RND transporter periplasmic adaptor subunit [Burkholderiaceae bacterium]
MMRGSLLQRMAVAGALVALFGVGAAKAQPLSPLDVPPSAVTAPATAPLMDPDVVRVLISPDQETTLVAPMNGRIARLGMTLGSRFDKDAVLTGFDCGENVARSKIAKAELRGARENFTAKSRLRALKAAGDVEVNLASAAVEKSAGEVELTKVLMDQCEVKAPFSGRVARIYVKQYQGVNAGAPLADIISDGPLKVRLNAPSKWLSELKVGMPFQVVVDETGRSYPASVSAVGARVDAAAQAIEIEGRFNDVHPELLAGMSGTVHFSMLK